MDNKVATTDPQDEVFDIVNTNDVVVGQATRKEAHQNPNLTHRVVHIWITNNAGEVLIQQRSLTKDKLPGYWDISCAGHVQKGFSVLETAERELTEELGISADCKFIKKYLLTQPDQSEMINVFSAIHEGPFNFSKEEINIVKFFSKDEVQKLIQTGEKISPFCTTEIPMVYNFLNSND